MTGRFAVNSRRADSVGPIDPERFRNPAPDSRPVALWFLNGTLTTELIDAQLAELRSAGIMGAVLFPYQGSAGYPATSPAYLSEGWFAMVEHALREAKRTGMVVWLFDDEFFPSGRGGGVVVRGDAVTAARPGARPSRLVQLERRCAGPADLRLDDIPRKPAPEGLGVEDGWIRFEADGICLVDGGSGWQDYTLAFTAALAPGPDGGQVGWTVRARDRENCTAWSLRSGNPATLRRIEIEHGTASATSDTALRVIIEPDHEYHLEVEVRDGTVTTRIDGVVVDRAPGSRTSAGGVGFFRELPTHRARIRNIRVLADHGVVLHRQDCDADGLARGFGSPTRQDDVECVVALRQRNGAAVLADAVDVTADLATGTWRVPPGEWSIRYYVRSDPRWIEPFREFMAAYESTDYVDPLNPVAVDELIDATYEEYHRRFGWAFGDVLRGFWNDEPIFAVRWPQCSRHVLWSPGLGRSIVRTGAVLSQTLPALFDDFGAQGDLARSGYWRAISARLADTYYRKLGDWAASRDVSMTSNPFGDGCGPATSLPLGGNLLRNNHYFQVPGCDTVHPTMAPDTQVRAQALVARHASSSAHQQGRRRVLVENMGAYGPGVAPRDVQFINAAFAVRGANLSVLHAFHLDRDPARYRHKPPLDPSNPWWPHMARLADWIGRVAEANQGLVALQTAVIHSQRSAEVSQPVDWRCTMAAYERFAAGGGYASPIDRALHDTVVALEDQQVDLDLLDDSCLDDDTAPVRVEVLDGRLRVGEQSYRLVVLPTVPYLSLEAAQLLTRFVRAGGHLIAVRPLPARESRGRDADLTLQLRELFTAAPRTGAEAGAGGIATVVGSVGELAHHVRDLGVAAARLDPPAADVRILRRTRDGDAVYLVFNEGSGVVRTGATFPSRGVPQVWDPWTGRPEQSVRWTSESDGTRVDLVLERSQLVVVIFPSADRGDLLVGDAGGPDVPPPHGPGPAVRTIDLDGAWRLRFSGDQSWHRRDLGSWSDIAPGHSGTGEYAYDITLPAGAFGPQFRVELDLGEVREVADVRINGDPVGAVLCPPYRLDASGHFRDGVNTLSVTVTNTPANAMGEPLESGLLGPVAVRIYAV